MYPSKFVVYSLLFALLSSCAAMFNKSNQYVRFVNAPVKGTTKVFTPYGKISLKDGESNAVFMTRSRQDVPISIKCPNGKVEKTEMKTKFDFLVGGVVNILNLPIGWLIDPFVDKAYIYEDFNVGAFCSNT